MDHNIPKLYRWVPTSANTLAYDFFRFLRRPLVSNAIKFADSGYVRVHFSRYDTKRLQVEVQDSGPGIPDHLQERIFEPFDRGTEAVRHLQGSGLGLAISRQLVNLMGGKIWLRSTPGQGSTFYFTAELPEYESEPSEDPALTSPDSACETPAHTEHIAGMQVLVGEDEPTNILLIQALLEYCGAEAIVAENGQEALDIWQRAEQEFDLIMLDMQMPILDGVQTLRVLRKAEVEQKRGYTPVAMLSAHATAEVREQCLQSGADIYMTKPVRLDSLAHLLSWAKEGGNTAKSERLTQTGCS
ncbi:ATP-binding protein [Halorhodospira halochloris]|uniref:ATP-binding protein n=1 Tax=Halorhodospira halochloris TaxID=1052 RepID=UPI001EE8EE2F|nr:ATP-binding protein [Halorhodospira halochloris]MCG5549288.1 ATP-binding protein [Halorhodospira halochloris]